MIRQWRRVIEAFRSGASETFADKVDWLAKRRLFDMLRNRAGSRLSVSKLEQLDMDYHDVANGALYASLCRRGAMRTLVNESQAHEVIDVPPHDTRAALRGRFIQSARSHNAQYSCDWTRLSLTSPNRMDVTLLDPFDAQPVRPVPHDTRGFAVAKSLRWKTRLHRRLLILVGRIVTATQTSPRYLAIICDWSCSRLAAST